MNKNKMVAALHHDSVCELFKMTEAGRKNKQTKPRIEYTLRGSTETLLRHDTELNASHP